MHLHAPVNVTIETEPEHMFHYFVFMYHVLLSAATVVLCTDCFLSSCRIDFCVLCLNNVVNSRNAGIPLERSKRDEWESQRKTCALYAAAL